MASIKSKIRKTGNSLCVYLDGGALEKVYGMREGSEIELDYAFPVITIKKTTQPIMEGI